MELNYFILIFLVKMCKKKKYKNIARSYNQKTLTIYKKRFPNNKIKS